MSEGAPNNGSNNDNPNAGAKPKCGIIMPISAIDGLPEEHWREVNSILSGAIRAAGFEPDLVSTAEEVGIIQKTIVQNLYENPVVVCDVSGKNPNVMFELGMRLAFDKPTIIVKDDETSYTFDTSSIEHLNYRRDLRYFQIEDFKTKLAQKIKSTYDKASNDASYTTFLKHFGEFTVAKIEQKEVSSQEYIIEELRSLRQLVARLDKPGLRSGVTPAKTTKHFVDGSGWPAGTVDEVVITLGDVLPGATVSFDNGLLTIEHSMPITNDQARNLQKFIERILKEGRAAVLKANTFP